MSNHWQQWQQQLRSNMNFKHFVVGPNFRNSQLNWLVCVRLTNGQKQWSKSRNSWAMPGFFIRKKVIVSFASAAVEGCVNGTKRMIHGNNMCCGMRVAIIYVWSRALNLLLRWRRNSAKSRRAMETANHQHHRHRRRYRKMISAWAAAQCQELHSMHKLMRSHWMKRGCAKSAMKVNTIRHFSHAGMCVHAPSAHRRWLNVRCAENHSNVWCESFCRRDPFLNTSIFFFPYIYFYFYSAYNSNAKIIRKSKNIQNECIIIWFIQFFDNQLEKNSENTLSNLKITQNIYKWIKLFEKWNEKNEKSKLVDFFLFWLFYILLRRQLVCSVPSSMTLNALIFFHEQTRKNCEFQLVLLKFKCHWMTLKFHTMT